MEEGMAKLARRRSHVLRQHIAHRVLYYLKTNAPKLEFNWTNATIFFLFESYELMRRNPGLYLVIHAVDGVTVYFEDRPVVFLHLRQKHFLVHSNPRLLIWSQGDKLFGRRSRVKGSWARMWKVENFMQVRKLLSYFRSFPTLKAVAESKASRSIPATIQQQVWERDRAKCRKCGATEDLHFDHIIPFVKKGTSKLASNIQLLCMGCNLQKGSKFG